jgi:hypothetical protein
MSDESTETPDAGVPAAGEQVVSRRAALKVLGTVPIIGAIGGAAWAQQPVAQQPRQTHEAPNQPAHGPTAPASSQPKQKFFNAAELRIVSVLADDVIPRDERSGSATQAGVPAFIDFHMSVPETSDDTRIAMRGGLHWLDTECRRRFGTGYARAAAAQRHQILDDIAWPEKARPEMSAGVAFFNRFRDMVASGFFSSPIGWTDLRYQGNVFNPGWNGCPEPALTKLGVSYAAMQTRIAPE